jgi:hypothetical protein
MSTVSDPILRIADVISIWVLASNSTRVSYNRTMIHTLLFITILLTNIANIAYLNYNNSVDVITIVRAVAQIIIYAIVLAIVIINETSNVNVLSRARKTFLGWLSFIILYEPLFTSVAMMYARSSRSVSSLT